MEFDFSKLRGRIVEKCGSVSAFAKKLGISDPAASYRLSNKTPWSGPEIYLAIQPDCLDIEPEDIPSYFFAPKVR